jgi:acyl-CoA thioester hydrolase
MAQTRIPDGPAGARFDRCTTFRDQRGRVLVDARTTWALIDRTTGRLARVTAEIAAPFLA